jgi:hypothetical protein
MTYTRKYERKGECVLCKQRECKDSVCERIIDMHGYYEKVGGKTVLKITQTGLNHYEKIKK